MKEGTDGSGLKPSADAARLKFRAWDPFNKRMYKNPFVVFDEYGAEAYDDHREWEDCIRRGSVLMQWTGLKDKNGLTDIYEGDIIDETGFVKGNIYESPGLIEIQNHLLIEGMGSKKWATAEQEALGRGCRYA